jgi:ATP-dependent helicase/nuclease subunit A
MVCSRDGLPELKSPAGKALLSKIWPVVKPAYAEAAARTMSSADPFAVNGEKNKGREKDPIDQFLRRLASGWMLPVPPPPVQWNVRQHTAAGQDGIEYSPAGEAARHIGSVVHRWLQRIAEDGVKNWSMRRIQALRDAFRHQLVACGMDPNDSDIDTAARRVIMALTHAVSDTRGQWLLGTQQDARNKVCMTGVIGGEHMSLVIDRTFRDANGQRWVVDYKASSHEGADVESFLDREQERYRLQLDCYAALIRLIDGRPVKRGLYFPLLKEWREWGDEE